jgi:hypothetical protein
MIADVDATGTASAVAVVAEGLEGVVDLAASVASTVRVSP